MTTQLFQDQANQEQRKQARANQEQDIRNPGNPVALRAAGQYRRWLGTLQRRPAGEGRARGLGRQYESAHSYPAEHVLRDLYELLARCAVDRSQARPESLQWESGEYAGVKSRSKPREADIRDSVATLAAFDATILLGPLVYAQGGMVRGARTTIAHPERSGPTREWIDAEKSLQRASERLGEVVKALQDLKKQRDDQLGNIKRVRGQAVVSLTARAVKLSDEAIVAFAAGNAPECLSKLEEIRTLTARKGFNLRMVSETGKVLDPLRVEKISSEALLVLEDLGRAIKVPPAPEVVPEVERAIDRLANGSSYCLLEALTACRRARDLLDAQRGVVPPEVQRVFYWRVHAMLTALPATRKLDWLSEHFDWKQQRAQHERIRGKIEADVREQVRSHGQDWHGQYTTPGHRYVHLVWAREDRGH